MVEVIIPVNCFILFHCGSLSWYIDKGEYHSNTRAFCYIVETSYQVRNEVIVQIKNQLCDSKKFDVCKKNQGDQIIIFVHWLIWGCLIMMKRQKMEKRRSRLKSILLKRQIKRNMIVKLKGMEIKKGR